jgi:nucleoside-diphosphate-sugar epimerase
MKRVLVTGATGFVGRHCLPLLVLKHYEVHAVARRRLSLPALSGISWHEIDLLTPGTSSELLRRLRPEYLLHLAWHAVPGEFWDSSENLEWVRASLELLPAFVKNGGRRLVAAGSCAEYDWNGGECKEDTTALLPCTLYGTAKYACERILHSWSRQAGLSSAWGRIFFMYGPYEHPLRLVAYVVRMLIRGQPALCSDGTQIRDFLHVEDVASAFVALMESEVQGPVNIGSGTPVAVRDLLLTIGRYLGRPELIHFGARNSIGEPAALWANVVRLAKEVGWKPHYDSERGVQQTIEWWRGSDDLEGAVSAQPI